MVIKIIKIYLTERDYEDKLDWNGSG